MSAFPPDKNQKVEEEEEEEEEEDEDTDEDGSGEEISSEDEAHFDALSTLFEESMQRHCESADCKTLVGLDVWNSVMLSPIMDSDAKEAIVRKNCGTIVRSVCGFSDYRDCFADGVHFLQLGIERLGLDTALCATEACLCMYATTDVDTFYMEHWAEAAIQRFTQFLSEPTSDASGAVGALPQLLALERACTNVGNKPSVLADILLEAYNTLCEQDDQTLQLQVQASRGPLTTAAVQVLQTYNEGKKGKGVFLEACMLLQLLLKPWGETEAHTTTKREIAHTLQEAGIVPAVMRQMVFWAEDWQGMYGDCGRPCFKILLELLRHIPETRTAVGESVRQFVAQASLHQSTGTGAAIEGYEYETPTSTLHRINQLLQN
ncbi:hypothetical protein B484DRAFT_436090 [Ochromonadaceae sp. CCMP2298]|nr:hypothetical protein B484DRAFT_436090 [Ochromonadaceae sp. CCMP2298]